MKINNRLDLARYFNKLGFKVGAEIGVKKGDYALVLCKEIPGLKYYGIDSWGGDNPKHKNYGKHEYAKKVLSPYDATLIKKLSMDALGDFENGSLDFVYIDANHRFDYVVSDIIGWTKKVKKGGIISGHDYKVAKTCGVIPAVDGYVTGHRLGLKLTTDESEGLSWWFTKRWNT